MARSGASAIAGLGLLLAACGGGSAASPDAATTTTPDGGTTAPLTDISGWYQVTSYVAGPCGAPTPSPLLAPDYVFVDRAQNTFVLRTCSGTTKADCQGTLFYDFTQPIANGLRAVGGIAFYSDGCTLTVERSEATLEGDTLTVKSLKDRLNDQRAEADCTLEQAEMLTGPCVYETDLVGTRLPASP
jgi:hypothetical protein